MPETSRADRHIIIILPKRKTTGSGQRRRPHLLTFLSGALAIIAAVHFIAVTHSAYPASVPATCEGWLRTRDFTQIVHLNAKTQQMGAIQFVDQLIGGQPAVMVQDASTDAQQKLDVYIFGCVQHKQQFSLTTLFAQHDLIEGTASTSDANTLITSQLDTSQPAQNSVLEGPLQQNIYREYRWQRGAFTQIAFPSLYPVASRSEAEALQQQADNGQSLPWSDPLVTAEQMAKDLFQWTGSDPQDMVTSNNGTTARVQLVQQSPPVTIIVTLKRLIRQNAKGLWFVTGVQSNGFTLAHPASEQRITSPLALTGAGALADGTLTVELFNHAFNPVSLTITSTPVVDSSGNYTTTISYSLPLPEQEGLLLVESSPPGGSSEAGQLLMEKVIIG